MKASAIIRIILLSLLILILASILIGGLAFHKYIVSGEFGEIFEKFMPVVDGTVASEGSVSAEEVKSLEINWVSGSVTIIRADVTDISFHEDAGLKESQQLVWKQEGDRLVIHSTRVKIQLGTSKSKNLVVTIPMDYNMNELEIGTVSATFNADSLVANTVTIQGVSGKCIFTGNNAFGTMNVETVSGDVTFNGTLRQLTCEGVSANFRGYFTETPNSIQVDGVSGDIDITLPADAGFTAELDTLNGHFNSDFSTTSSGDRYICGNGQCTIEVDGVSGDINIRKAN